MSFKISTAVEISGANPRLQVVNVVARSKEGVPVGQAILLTVRGKQKAELARLVVDPEYRRRGIGRAVLKVVETGARERGIETIISSLREPEEMGPFYKKCGYRVIGSRAEKNL